VEETEDGGRYEYLHPSKLPEVIRLDAAARTFPGWQPSSQGARLCAPSGRGCAVCGESCAPAHSPAAGTGQEAVASRRNAVMISPRSAGTSTTVTSTGRLVRAETPVRASSSTGMPERGMASSRASSAVGMRARMRSVQDSGPWPASSNRLSSTTRTGRVRGLPAPGPGTRSVFISCGKTVQSLRSPAVATSTRVSPWPSTARWTLPVGPPWDRPRARRYPWTLPFCGRRPRVGERARSWSRCPEAEELLLSRSPVYDVGRRSAQLGRDVGIEWPFILVTPWLPSPDATGRVVRPAAAGGAARRRERPPGSPVMRCGGASSRRSAG
jgi:hypothetical protein